MGESEKYFWVTTQANGNRRIGLTDFAVDDLGVVKYIDLPEVGTQLHVDGPFVSMEAEKAVSDIFSPVDGTVVSRNSHLDQDLSSLNAADASERWILEVK